MLRPLGHKILVKPDPVEAPSSTILAPDTWAVQVSGDGEPRRTIVEKRNDPEMGGEVVSVGNGPAAAHRIRTKTIARCMKLLDEVAERVPSQALRVQLMDELARYQMETVCLSEVQPGDQVIFPYTAGQKIQVDDQTYILLAEDDISAVWKTEDVA
jgi:co-chaperonin GroES (HSP10)